MNAIFRVGGVIPWVLAALAFMLTAWAFYPGYVSFDGAYQYWQIRHGELTTQHPPFMTLVWMGLDRVHEGPGGFLLLNLALYWLSLKWIADVLFQRWWSQSLFIILVGFWPYNLLMLPNVLKDVCMMVGFMMAAACVLKHRDSGHTAWLAGAILFAGYAGLMRHNALAGAIPFFLYVAWQLGSKRSSRLLLAVSFPLGIVVLSQLINVLPMVKRQVVWPTLGLWDLAQVSVREDRLLLPPFTIGPGMTVEELDQALVHWTNVTLFSRTPSGINHGLDDPYEPGQYQELFRAWLGMVRAYPSSYLDHRMRLAGALYGLTDYPEILEHAYDGRIVAYRDNPEVEINRTRLNRLLLSPLIERVESWPFRGWVYVLLCLLCGIVGAVLVRKGHGREHSKMALFFAGSGLLFTAPLLMIAPAAPIRFHSWLVICALLSVAALLAGKKVEER